MKKLSFVTLSLCFLSTNHLLASASGGTFDDLAASLSQTRGITLPSDWSLHQDGDLDALLTKQIGALQSEDARRYANVMRMVFEQQITVLNKAADSEDPFVEIGDKVDKTLTLMEAEHNKYLNTTDTSEIEKKWIFSTISYKAAQAMARLLPRIAAHAFSCVEAIKSDESRTFEFSSASDFKRVQNHLERRITYVAFKAAVKATPYKDGILNLASTLAKKLPHDPILRPDLKGYDLIKVCDELFFDQDIWCHPVMTLLGQFVDEKKTAAFDAHIGDALPEERGLIELNYRTTARLLRAQAGFYGEDVTKASPLMNTLGFLMQTYADRINDEFGPRTNADTSVSRRPVSSSVRKSPAAQRRHKGQHPRHVQETLKARHEKRVAEILETSPRKYALLGEGATSELDTIAARLVHNPGVAELAKMIEEMNAITKTLDTRLAHKGRELKASEAASRASSSVPDLPAVSGPSSSSSVRREVIDAHIKAGHLSPSDLKKKKNSRHGKGGKKRR
ncbi:MAG: hypothetical protein LCH26_07100 [Proteobacteria bacterium]|nr:hypothetical protein [Pseudomonadota bacterium]